MENSKSGFDCVYDESLICVGSMRSENLVEPTFY